MSRRSEECHQHTGRNSEVGVSWLGGGGVCVLCIVGKFVRCYWRIGCPLLGRRFGLLLCRCVRSSFVV